MVIAYKHYRVTALLPSYGPNGALGAWTRVVMRVADPDLPHTLSMLRVSQSTEYDVKLEDPPAGLSISLGGQPLPRT